MVIAHRGGRVSAMLLGIVGAVLQITAITQVVADGHDPAGIVAYAVGVGFGVMLGLVAGERFTSGMISVIITKAPDLARSLWDKGWPVTAQPGHAENGPVTVLSVPVSRHDEARLHHDVRSIAPDAVGTTKDLRAPNLVHQPDKPKRLRARPGIDGPLRRGCCQQPAGVGTADQRILDRAWRRSCVKRCHSLSGLAVNGGLGGAEVPAVVDVDEGDERHQHGEPLSA